MAKVTVTPDAGQSVLKLKLSIPFDGQGFSANVGPDGTVVPYEYSGWRDEMHSWVSGSYLGTGLSMTWAWSIKGPDAQQFLKDFFINRFDTFEVGATIHGIMVNEEGVIVNDGVIMHISEDEYFLNCVHPYLQYVWEMNKHKYNAVAEDLSRKRVMYQVAGPTSLQLMEKVTGQNLHNIKYHHHEAAKICGHDVFILRLGMSGTLGYEVHADMEYAHEIYEAIWQAGKEKYGLRKLGQLAYLMNHTEDGFPQYHYHFAYPWLEDEGFMSWLRGEGKVYLVQDVYPDFTEELDLFGSMGKEDRSILYRDPVQVGWDCFIDFSRDFLGKAALEKLVAERKSKMVSLEWNAEDIGKVFISQFDGSAEPYCPMDRPNDFYYPYQDPYIGTAYHTDRVEDAEGNLVGMSSGRARSAHYNRMISLCTIDVKYQEGDEVFVVWGEPGKRQLRIRATVSRFPYLQETRSEDLDVSKIPFGFEE